MAEIKDRKSPAETSKKKLNELKQEPSNLRNGTATPYIALFDQAGSPIINPLTGISLGAYVSKFNFVSGDQKEDNLNIIVDTGDPDTVDIPEIQEGKTLLVQWGYIYSDGSSHSSTVHSVEIKQIDVTFDDQGTHITIIAKDKVSDLRLSAPYRPIGEEGYTLKTFLDEGMGLNMGIIIELFE